MTAHPRPRADIGHWPCWNRAVASVSIDGDIAPGTGFEWKAGPGTIRSTLLQVERPTGLTARLLRVPLRRSLERALAEGLADLKTEAERRAGAR